MSLIAPDFTESVIVRSADAEVIGQPPPPSDRASCVTGTGLRVDGGARA
jgi:hypothetical protein